MVKTSINYGFADTKFGKVLIGFTAANEIVYIAFADKSDDNSLAELKHLWKDCDCNLDQASAKILADKVFEKNEGNFLLLGSEFQNKIWQELTKIPFGKTTSYNQVAKNIGRPLSARAVASAIAKNKIAYLIPCHRVIHKSGTMGGYRWGVDRKEAILKFENADFC